MIFYVCTSMYILFFTKVPFDIKKSTFSVKVQYNLKISILQHCCALCLSIKRKTEKREREIESVNLLKKSQKSFTINFWVKKNEFFMD